MQRRATLPRAASVGCAGRCAGRRRPAGPEGARHDPDPRATRRRRPVRPRPGGRLARRLRGGPDGARRRPRGRACSRPSPAGATWSSFTWNITTVEGPDGRAPTCSTATLERTDAVRLRHRGAGRRGRRGGHGVVPLRDRRRPRPRPAAAEGGGRRGPRLDPPHHALRAQGATRSRAATHRPMGAEHGADKRPRDVEGAAAGGGREPGQHDPALRAGHRRRPGRHRPRCAAAPARRAEPGDRQAPAARRPVAQPLQVALPARPGLVRPPALPEVPRQLAGLRAQGQDRRLARVLHARSWRCPTGRAPTRHQRDVVARRRGSGPSRSSARASR